jgi:hypothetical protein
MDANNALVLYNKDLVRAVRYLYRTEKIMLDKDIVTAMATYKKNTVSGYISGRVKASQEFRTKFEQVFNLKLADFQDELPKISEIEKKEESSQAFLAGKLAGKEEVIQQIEARRLDAVSWAEKEREDKVRAEKEKDRLYDIIEKYLADIHANSVEIASDLSALTLEVQAEHRAIMDTVDKAAGQRIGTTYENADKIEIASQKERQKKGKAGVDKQG